MIRLSGSSSSQRTTVGDTTSGRLRRSAEQDDGKPDLDASGAARRRLRLARNRTAGKHSDRRNEKHRPCSNGLSRRNLKGCPALDTSASLPSSALPFLGTACGKANSIQCDRIGVGVTLDEVATLVVVRIAGRLVTLSPPDPNGSSNIWLGYLQGAGPAHGPLRVRAPRHDGLWFGTPLRFARARVIAFFPDGRVDSEAATVMVHPGFG